MDRHDADEGGAGAAPARRSSPSGPRSPRTSRCCTCSSTSHSAGSLELLFDTEGGAQDSRFVGGSQRVPIALARAPGRRGGAHRRAGAPDRARRRRRDRARRRAPRCARRRAIVAIAARRWPAGSSTTRRCPGYRDQLTQRMPLGTVAKCMAIYDEPFWRAEGLSGQAHQRRRPGEAHLRQLAPRRLAGRAAGIPRGPARPRHGPGGAGGAPGRGDRLLRAPVRRARRASPARYVERLWAEEEYTRGCYGCHMPTGAWTSYGEALRAPIGPLHWAWHGDRRGLVGLHGRRGARRGDRGAGGARARCDRRAW